MRRIENVQLQGELESIALVGVDDSDPRTASHLRGSMGSSSTFGSTTTVENARSWSTLIGERSAGRPGAERPCSICVGNQRRVMLREARQCRSLTALRGAALAVIGGPRLARSPYV